jgi:hypothetical protein
MDTFRSLISKELWMTGMTRVEESLPCKHSVQTPRPTKQKKEAVKKKTLHFQMLYLKLSLLICDDEFNTKEKESTFTNFLLRDRV